MEWRTKKLGRLPRQPRIEDHNFLIRKLVKKSARKYRHWRTDFKLDQGSTSKCVSYSGTGLLLASPVRNLGAELKKNQLQEFLDWLYTECQKNDEWAGENYDGTSVWACMKVLHDAGYISEYRWAFEIETMIEYVLEIGPMQVGTIWTNSMFDVDRKGYIHVDTDIIGGHAYLITGVNRTKRNPDGSRGAFRILNSWGKLWGQKGEAWISFGDMRILMNENGEAAAPTEVLKKVA